MRSDHPSNEAKDAALTCIGMVRSAISLLASLAGIPNRDSQKTGTERASMFNGVLTGVLANLARLPGLCDDAEGRDSVAASCDAYYALALVQMVGDVVWSSDCDGTIPEPNYADIGRTLLLAVELLNSIEGKVRQPDRRQAPTSGNVPSLSRTSVSAVQANAAEAEAV